MLGLVLRYEDGAIETRALPLPFEIGRSPECGLRVRAWRVARRHARFYWSDAGAMIEDFGSLCGTLVNGRRITQYGPLRTGDELLIGPCLIRVDHVPDAGVQPAWEESGGIAPSTEESGARRRDGAGIRPRHDAAPGLPECPPMRPLVAAPSTAPGVAAAPSGPVMDVQAAATSVSLQDRLHHRRRLHGSLIEALDLRRRDIAALSDAALRAEARAALTDIIADDAELPSAIDRDELLAEVVDEAVGLGPLEPLLADPDISEIMVNRHDEIFIEKTGMLVRHGSGFSSEQAVQGVIERIVSPLGRRIDESSPMVDARLRDGSRVNAVIPPVALRGSSLTIRKFPLKRPGMDDLVRLGTLDASIRTFLETCVARKKNIVVSGGTGSGKTTLLNILSNSIPEGERIVTIEDAAELRLGHAHLVSLEARPANLEGSGRIDIRDLVRNALRMRPDRIVIGECRGGEAFDMLAAMNTGHEGSLTTLHANSPRDALARLETMILMAGMDLPLAVVREHIAASIDVIVQQARSGDGRRLIMSVVEVTGMESGRIQLQELFRHEPGPPGGFVDCGLVPECLARGASPAPDQAYDRWADDHKAPPP